MNSPERRWKRFKVDIRVRLRRWEEAEDTASVVRSHEMSEGGMSVYSPDELEIGTYVVITFSWSPEEKGLRIRAVVRYRRGFRCGLEFVDLTAAERLEIAHYLGVVSGSAES